VERACATLQRGNADYGPTEIIATLKALASTGTSSNAAPAEEESEGEPEEAPLKSADRRAAQKAAQYLDELRRFSIWGYQDINVQDLLMPRRLAVFDLAGTDKVVGAYAAERVLREIWRRALSGQLQHPVFIVLEEAHNLIPASGSTRASRIINTIAAEGRKFRVFLTLITQRPSKVSQDTLSQCGSQIVMQLTNPDDQHAVQKASEAISAELLADLPGLNKGEAIVLGQLTRVPVMVRVAGRASAEGGSDVDVVAALARAQKDASVSREAAAMRTSGAAPRQQEEW